MSRKGWTPPQISRKGWIPPSDEQKRLDSFIRLSRNGRILFIAS
jgi:hypothetical protein